MFPKMGTKLHNGQGELAFARIMADALHAELGQTHQAIKSASRWTGACERTVKHWFAGTHAPSGEHLLLLMRHSDGVLRRILAEAGREDMLVMLEVSDLRWKLTEILTLIGPAPGAAVNVTPGT